MWLFLENNINIRDNFDIIGENIVLSFYELTNNSLYIQTFREINFHPKVCDGNITYLP